MLNYNCFSEFSSLCHSHISIVILHVCVVQEKFIHRKKQTQFSANIVNFNFNR